MTLILTQHQHKSLTACIPVGISIPTNYGHNKQFHHSHLRQRHAEGAFKGYTWLVDEKKVSTCNKSRYAKHEDAQITICDTIATYLCFFSTIQILY